MKVMIEKTKQYKTIIQHKYNTERLKGDVMLNYNAQS